MMSALAKDKQFPALKKRGGVCSPSNHEFRQKEGHWRSKQWVPGYLAPPAMSNVYQEPKHLPRDGSGSGEGKHNAILVFGAMCEMGEEAYIDPSSMFTALKTTWQNKNKATCSPAQLPLQVS